MAKRKAKVQPPLLEWWHSDEHWWQAPLRMLKQILGQRERRAALQKVRDETPLSASANGTLAALRQRVLVGIVDGQRIYGNGRVRKLERRR